MHPKQLHPENRAGCWPCFSTSQFHRQKHARKSETPQEFLLLITKFSILQQITEVSQFSSTSTEVFRNTFLIHAFCFLKGIGKGKGVPVGSRLTCPENKPAAASLSFYVCTSNIQGTYTTTEFTKTIHWKNNLSPQTNKTQQESLHIQNGTFKFNTSGYPNFVHREGLQAERCSKLSLVHQVKLQINSLF